MPRRRPDKVIEHRISLSDFERAEIKEALTTQQVNVTVDAITATLQAGGAALGGAGGLLAAFVLLKWKAPEIISDITDNITNPIFDTITDVILPGRPIELRREAQALAERRGQINREINAFCTLSASTADAAKCAAAQDAKDAYFSDLAAHQQRVLESAAGRWGWADLIWQGLGDIDPNQDSNPNNDYEDGIQWEAPDGFFD